jgi:hypothetical protein
MVLGEKDKLDAIEKRLDLGLISQIEAIAIDRGVTKEIAEEMAEEIVESQMELMSGKVETDSNGRESEVGSESRRAVRDTSSELN